MSFRSANNNTQEHIDVQIKVQVNKPDFQKKETAEIWSKAKDYAHERLWFGYILPGFLQANGVKTKGMTRSEMNWKIFRSVLPLAALVAFTYYTQKFKFDNIESEPALITDADDLIWRFQVKEGDFLVNKVIQVNGIVTKLDSLLIVLNHRIICSSESQIDAKLRDSLKLKGRISDYDEFNDRLVIKDAVKVMN